MNQRKFLKTTGQEVEILATFEVGKDTMHYVTLTDYAARDLGSTSVGGSVKNYGDGPVYDYGTEVTAVEIMEGLCLTVHATDLVDSFAELKQIKELESVKKEVSENRTIVNELKNEAKSITKEIEALKTSLDDLKKNITTEENKLQAVKDDTARANLKYAERIKETEKLEQLAEKLKGSIDKYREIMSTDNFKAFETFFKTMYQVPKISELKLNVPKMLNQLELELKEKIEKIYKQELGSNLDKFRRFLNGNDHTELEEKYSIKVSEVNSENEYYQKGQHYNYVTYKVTFEDVNLKTEYRFVLTELCDKDGFISTESVDL